MESKLKKLASFNPNDVGVNNGNLYGLPFTAEESEIVIIPVPWDVTVSYGSGTSHGPEAILNASPQIDYYLPNYPETWKKGIFLESIPENILEKSKTLRAKTSAYIEFLESGGKLEENKEYQELLQEVNQECRNMIAHVKQRAEHWMAQGKFVAVLGGDHSSPLGLMKALATVHKDFGVLTIDAHADLRNAYEGFTYSHASIFFNALEEIPEISNMTQVGIRDFCSDEALYAQNNPKIQLFPYETIKQELIKGTSWDAFCDKIIASLPQNIYLSFDIDGLDPKLCPNTGTPVPGGFEFYEALHLIEKIVQSGRKIIGFDLCEVCPGEDEWDANVGARLLYNICARV
jgi:agmatinase